MFKRKKKEPDAGKAALKAEKEAAKQAKAEKKAVEDALKAREAQEAARKAKESEEAARRAKDAQDAVQRAKDAQEAAQKASDAEEAARKAREAREAAQKAKKAAAEAVPASNAHLLAVIFGDPKAPMGRYIANRNTRKMFTHAGKHALEASSRGRIETAVIPPHSSPLVWAYECKLVLHDREPGPNEL